MSDSEPSAERSYVVTVEEQSFTVAWVQCDVSGDRAWVRRHHSIGDRHPMRVAVAVSVPTEMWSPSTSAGSVSRRGRLIEDHEGVVTLWASPDDLKDLLERWPVAPAGLNSPYNNRLRQHAADALRLRTELEVAWMGEAARTAAIR